MSKDSKKINSILYIFNSGNKSKAINEIKKLIDNNKSNLEYIYAYGLMLKEIKDYEKAINCFNTILSKSPSNMNALFNLYPILLEKKLFKEALNIVNQLIKKLPENFTLRRDRSYLNFIFQNYQISLNQINEALEVNSKDVFALNIKGLNLLKLDHKTEAIKNFENAIALDSTYKDSFNNLGMCYYESEDLNKAYEYFKLAHRLDPDYELSLNNIANILSLKDKNKYALKIYETLYSKNNNKKILINIFLIHCKLNNINEANIFYNLAKKYYPDNYNMHLAYCYLLIKNNKYEDAWNKFDSRLETNKAKKINFNYEIIKNKSVTKSIDQNKKILIAREQGIGEEILFSSMYKDLLLLNKNVKIECDPRLISIFQRSFGKNYFYENGTFTNYASKIHGFDSVFYAGSLTKIFRKSIKDFPSKPFLIADKTNNKKIGKILSKISNKPKIGISWKSVVNIYGKLKSLTVDDFKMLFDDDKTFINLQYGNVNEEISIFQKNGNSLITLKEIDLFNDLDKTLSLLNNLDMFITVSNSTAHIAAGLGVPTALICPKKSSTYFYWNYENYTPWYNNIKIFKIEDSIKKTMEDIQIFINKNLCKLKKK